jgi:hypothetical protein
VPAPLRAPLGHTRHVDSLVAADDVEYFPGPHFTQSENALFPVVGEYLPAVQDWHVVEPVFVLYFPAAHDTHGPPVGPAVPVGHAVWVEAGTQSERNSNQNTVCVMQNGL